MKPYVLIILLFIGFGCRSSRNTTDTYISDHSKQTKKEFKDEKIHSSQQYLTSEKKEVATDIDEEIITVNYDTQSGKVQSVQTVRRGTRRSELSDSTGRSSNDTLINRNDSTSTDIANDIELKQTTQSHTDNRPVQGVEWLYVACVGGIVILIIIIFAWPKTKK